MNERVSKSQFKAKALQLFRQIEASGRPVIVTDRGEPRLEVRRYCPDPSDALAALRGSVLRYDDPTEPIDAEDWEAAK